ncbi:MULTISPECIES: type IV secretory system conjugative DNA transfer family protein [Nocardia]|uniref:type IV secretory system conjugative DNA transfer family protein n=1 Tax=Nocardia TaxID=1817 RepID=UPI0002DC4A6F|nr:MULTISPECIES: TraM recognition domain-containing protein [Nocardia]
MISTRETRRRTKSGIGEETTILMLFVAAVAVALTAWAALSLGRWWAGLPVTGNPAAALLAVALGKASWPWQATLVAVALYGLEAGALVAGWRLLRTPHEIDSAARTMQRPSQIRIARAGDNAAANRRLLADAPEDVQELKGPPLGRTVVGGVELFVPAELGVTIAAGTRTGKTMAWAIPAVLAAWGPCLATSNKPDLYRHTLAGRQEAGDIWLSDLQGVTGTPTCGFWVNLLTQVTGLPAARKLAGFFVSASSGTAAQAANAKVDSYFDGGAQELLALYILAAARAGGDLLHVAEWLGKDQDPTPALILNAHGQRRPAERIRESQALYSRQRDGLYDMARRFLNVLADADYARMVTPPSRTHLRVREGKAGVVIENTAQPRTHELPEFKPVDFVESTDTVYALSMAGPDGATPLTSALVGQIIEAALSAARARPDGRLAVPLLGVLDEAANCARISELPSYYTYSGGCGIILMTILQVLEQGEDLWGANGLKTMRAQSIEVYGGGIAAVDYLQHWSQMAGQHDVADRSRSRGQGGTNRTLSWRAEPILEVSQLAALPKDRALVRLPGHGPVLVSKTWWQDTEYAPLIHRSLKQFATDSQPVALVVPEKPDDADDGPDAEGQRS